MTENAKDMDEPIQLNNHEEETTLTKAYDFVFKWKIAIAILLAVGIPLLVLILIVGITLATPHPIIVNTLKPLPSSLFPTLTEYGFNTPTCTDQWHDAEEVITSQCLCSRSGGCEMFTCDIKSTTFYAACDPFCQTCNYTQTYNANTCYTIRGEIVQFQCGSVVGKNYTKITFDHLTGCFGKPFDVMHYPAFCDVGTMYYCTQGKQAMVRTYADAQCLTNYTEVAIAPGQCLSEGPDNFYITC